MDTEDILHFYIEPHEIIRFCMKQVKYFTKRHTWQALILGQSLLLILPLLKARKKRKMYPHFTSGNQEVLPIPTIPEDLTISTLDALYKCIGS